MKKILFSLFISILGFIGFGYCENGYLVDCNTLTNGSTFTLSSDSYIFPISLRFNLGSNNSYIILGGNGGKRFIYTSNNTSYGITISNTNYTSLEGPVLMSSGSYTVSSNNVYSCSFYVLPVSSISSPCECPTCPTCPSCPTLSGSCTVNDKVSENILFTGSKNFSTSYTNMFNYGDQGAGTYCMKFTSSNPQTLTMGFANGPTTTPTNLYSLYNDQYGNTICLYGNKPYLNVKLNSSSNTINYEVYKLTDLISSSVPCDTPSGPSCPTTGEILSGYILESDITQNYCEVRYDLITPEDCPVYTGSDFTGEVMWSSFWVNERQIMGGKNIYLYLPDFLDWDYTYVDQNLQIDVENEGDEEYIQSIIDINSYRPTSEDFTDTFVSGLTLVMPYIVVVLFIVFIWKLLKKIFK